MAVISPRGQASLEICRDKARRILGNTGSGDMLYSKVPAVPGLLMHTKAMASCQGTCGHIIH